MAVFSNESMKVLANETEENWVDADRLRVWHPFSQHGLKLDILPVDRARGSYLFLKDGKQVLDAISSWWVNLHGHANQEIATAIRDQALRLEHVIFAGFTHEPAARLAEKVCSIPTFKHAGLGKVFFSDNGSTAVEVALKMAFQFHVNHNEPQRSRFLALSNAYHGDTLGAMAVGEPEGFNRVFRKLMPPVDFVDPEDTEGLKRLLSDRGKQYAAFIFEPLIQGAGGMRKVSPEFLKTAHDLCRNEGILTIVDEIFTGFFRTGTWMATEQIGIAPDLVCLSKGLTGGFLPLAMTLCQERLFAGFLSDKVERAFLHGHSYTANPLACVAGIKSFEILNRPETQERIQTICKITAERIEAFRRHPLVEDARSVGTIGALTAKGDGAGYFSGKPDVVLQEAVRRGVLIRPLGRVFYAVPPYCCDESEIHRIYDVMESLLSI